MPILSNNKLIYYWFSNEPTRPHTS